MLKNLKKKLWVKNELGDYMKCPKCGSEMVKRNGKYGEFLSCSGFPDCKYSCDLDGSKNTFDRLNTGKYDDGICPNCGSPLVNKKGKFGEFLEFKCGLACE